MPFNSRYTNWVLGFGLFFFLFLFALIGFNILINTTHTFLFEILVDFLRPFSLFINIGLIFMMCLFGILFGILLWKFFGDRERHPIIKKNYTVPELKQEILRILAKKKGKYIYPTTLMGKSRFNGTLEEFKSVLQDLRQENRIEFDKDNYPYYSVRISNND